jgi:hypothetical protein
VPHQNSELLLNQAIELHILIEELEIKLTYETLSLYLRAISFGLGSYLGEGQGHDVTADESS